MATALPNNPNQECSICFEGFKTPKILFCGHSFCRECLESWIGDRRGHFPCPLCKQEIKIPQGGVEKFITNFSLQNSMDSTSLETKHYCPNHRKEIEYYCQTCNLGLCSKCIFKDHKDHKTLDLECDSTRVEVVQELSKSEQFIKNKIEDLEKTHATLLETSGKLKSLCDEACLNIREKTKNIIVELKANCKKRQKEIRNNFTKNNSKLMKTRKKVMTQIKNIKTDLDTSFTTTTEEPSLTLNQSLTKLQDLQKLCENMKTDIPSVTYVEWREGSAKVCDILGSTETKALYLIPTVNDGIVFKFHSKDIKTHNWYICKEKYKCHGVVVGCVVGIDDDDCNGYMGIDESLNIYIGLIPKENPRVEYCEITFTVTILNKDKDENIISDITTMRFRSDYMQGEIKLPWYEIIDPSEGYIDDECQIRVRFDIHHVTDIKYK